MSLLTARTVMWVGATTCVLMVALTGTVARHAEWLATPPPPVVVLHTRGSDGTALQFPSGTDRSTTGLKLSGTKRTTLSGAETDDQHVYCVRHDNLSRVAHWGPRADEPERQPDERRPRGDEGTSRKRQAQEHGAVSVQLSKDAYLPVVNMEGGPPRLEQRSVAVFVTTRAASHVFHAIMESAYAGWVSARRLPSEGSTPITVVVIPSTTCRKGVCRTGAVSAAVQRIMELSALAITQHTGRHAGCRFMTADDPKTDRCFGTVVVKHPYRMGIEPLQWLDTDSFEPWRRADAHSFRESTLRAMRLRWRDRLGTEPVRVTMILRDADEARSFPGDHADSLAAALRGLPGVAVTVVRLVESSMSWDDQVRLFAGTDVVVAGHGAGLIHEWWLPPHAHVVEIVPYGFDFMRFGNLARMLGISHTSFMTSSMHPSTDLDAFLRRGRCGVSLADKERWLHDVEWVRAQFRNKYTSCAPMRSLMRGQGLNLSDQMILNVTSDVRSNVARIRTQLQG